MPDRHLIKPMFEFSITQSMKKKKSKFLLKSNKNISMFKLLEGGIKVKLTPNQ